MGNEPLWSCTCSLPASNSETFRDEIFDSTRVTSDFFLGSSTAVLASMAGEQ